MYIILRYTHINILGVDPGSRILERGVSLNILIRRQRRFSQSEAPKGRGVGRDVLPTRLGGLGRAYDAPPVNPGWSPGSY